jgi:hypothetical protein
MHPAHNGHSPQYLDQAGPWLLLDQLLNKRNLTYRTSHSKTNMLDCLDKDLE